jgi:hypothetical protein
MSKRKPRPSNHEMRDPVPTARFWVWHGEGWVRLTLRPGTSHEVVTGGPHEEGYSHTATTWAHEGDRVTETTCTRGRDCDGRYEGHWERECRLQDLARVSTVDMWPEDYPQRFHQPAGVPDWRAVSSHQRDHSAEAMGY